ncbi:MAG: FAD-dependent oxidoreductase [Clostridiales bacterium]|jgi:NAD(P)H-nitrite reductase large subunit|nr:FAD-dependent oxidoreductase [Clostridiales bacterium]
MYVIIGNSAAAIGAVEGIRQMDESSQIVIVSDEPHHTYSRPLISYLLLGKTNEQLMKYRPDTFYENNNVTLLAPHRVTAIDPTEKTISLSSESKINYDKLLVAAGSSPFVPPMTGLDTVEKKFSFMSLDDARALERAVDDQSRVLIIGAGLIGLKCAEGILGRVRSVAVVDLTDRILSSILDEKGAAIVRRHLESKGVSFKLGTSVDNFEVNRAALKNGEHVEFDALVLAVGVKPNTGLVKALEKDKPLVNRGIITDTKMRTGINDIFAAGDCAESFDISLEANRVLAVLPNAYMQGETAGINMAGGNAEFNKAMPLNAIGFFGCHVLTAGSYVGDKIERSEGETYRLFFAQDNLLKGFMLINSPNRAGIYTSLIREKTPLDNIAQMIFDDPSLAAFSRAERKSMLGVVRYA